MDINKLKALSFDELRALYRNFLHSQEISKLTICTAYSDTFYLWRKGSKDLFWNTVTDTDFEIVAKSELIKTLSECSTGDVKSLASCYLSYLRKFRLFLSLEKTIAPAKFKQQIKVNSTQVSREIIINKMYVGAYLSEGDNIGHEIINLYRADDGKNYIFLNSQGTIALPHGKKRITVLLVRKSAMKTYKVLAKAEGVTILDFAFTSLLQEERYKGQVALGLTYGGISLVDLFYKNAYHGSLEDNKNAYTTFVADKVIKPKIQIYITDNASASSDYTFFIRTNKGFGKQTLREFYDENEKPDSFVDLNQIIENKKLWEDVNTTQVISKLPELKKDPYFNFLKIIKQEYNELAFSNMLAYFFSLNREAFSCFAKDVLQIEMQTEFTVEREKKNIDLLISDINNVVVIENKIKSGINGIDARHDIYSDQVQSQLKKYYQYVTTEDEYCTKMVSCFIFSPNYNRIELSKFSCGEKYTVIYYREIFNFFNKNKNLFDDVPYFEDFINTMYKHTMDYDNELEEEMQRRFQNTIYNAKKR